MSARIRPRRLGQSALAALSRPSTCWISTPSSVTQASIRKLSDDSTKSPQHQNPVLYKLLQQKQQKLEGQEPKVGQPMPTPGSLANTTIFKPDYEIQGWRDDLSEAEKQRLKERSQDERRRLATRRDAEISAAKLDPDPAGRRRIERKLVIQSLQRRGRLTKVLKLARTERQSLYKSQVLPTSVKKMTKLANQIAGKTVEEALVQLRFSKKKVARDMFKGLQHARDEAIVARGMGLGAIPEEADAKMEQEEARAETNKDLSKRREELLRADGSRRKVHKGEPTIIELKDGRTKAVHDPTEIYVDQAWVNRGPHWNTPEYRAMGRVNILTHRTTSFSVLLKEEKTRMRISEEIQKKRANRKVWVPLPDRPVTAQKQYCLW